MTVGLKVKIKVESKEVKAIKEDRVVDKTKENTTSEKSKEPLFKIRRNQTCD